MEDHDLDPCQFCPVESCERSAAESRKLFSLSNPQLEHLGDWHPNYSSEMLRIEDTLLTLSSELSTSESGNNASRSAKSW